MATGPSPATLKFFEDYKRQNTENNLCFECGRQNPQWASVNCGLLICLECSGKHRSIGVHLSFVRSLTMDVWSDRQIAFMQAGGNDKAKEWMERYSVKETDLKSKYSSPAFEAYREKLKAIVENRPYKDPSPEDLIKKASPYTSPYSSRTASPAPYSNGNYNSSSSSGSRSSPNPMSSSGGYGGGSDGRLNDIRSSNGYSNNSYGNNGYNNNNNGYNSYNGNNNGYNNNNNNNGYNSYNGNSNDMSRLQGRNAIGSSDFQQNNRNNNNDDDDLMNAFYDGWSKFSSGVKSVASTAAEKVSSGTLTDEVAQWASKVSESETWGFVSSFFSGQDSKSSQQQQQQRPPTRDEKSYSSDRPPPPRSSNDHNTERLDNGGRHQRYDDYSGFEDDRHSIRSQSQGRYDGRSSSHDLRQQPIQNGERHGLRSDPVMPRRPHSNPSRAANGWGDGADDWDDWSADKRKNEVSNPHVASMDDEVQVDDYAHAVAAPKPTRTVANDPHDIYNFQIAPSSGSNPSGQWEEWDDWGPKK